MHDIGKIGIPDSILLKQGPLDDAEWELMKSHTTIGYKMLDGHTSPIMESAKIIAYTHHEQWNGSGYPQGLKGDEIPLPGQICALLMCLTPLPHPDPTSRPGALTMQWSL